MAKNEQKTRRSPWRGIAAAAIVLLILAIAGIGGASFFREMRRMQPPESSVLTETTTTTTETTTTTSRYPQAATRTTETVTLSGESLIRARNAVLIEKTASGSRMIAERDCDTAVYPASLTKIMTLITFLEGYDRQKLDDVAEMRPEILEFAHANAASCAGFFAGELCTVRDLLYGLMLPSGADAALMLARLKSGSEAGFVAQMNALAAEMGLTQTHFVNCTGLHDEAHRSSVHDIARMLSYALDDPVSTEILSAAEHRTASTAQHASGIRLVSTVFSRMRNDLLTEHGCQIQVRGGKTGYTDEAGQCLATFADLPDGRRFLCVVAGCPPKAPMDAVFDTLTLFQLAEQPLSAIARIEPPAETTAAEADTTTVSARIE